MPRKVFVAGEILTAADVNTNLMDQAVMSFAGTAARGSAIGTAVEGMVTYLEDTDSFEYWDSSAWVALVPDVPGDNLLYNGAMQVAQRGTSETGITGTGFYTADRWRFAATSMGTWTNTLETDGPTGSGFTKSFKMECTTADGSPAASDRVYVQQALEGQDLQGLKKGTSAAESLTISFWVKSNVTGTYVLSLFDGDNTRHICQSYSVASSGTWEKKTLTFAGDTTGAFDNDNAASLYVGFYLGAGANYSSGSLATSWASYTAANDAAGQVNVAASTSNYWQVTGVQLETGTVATGFDHKPYGVELAECQRYYYRTGAKDGQTSSAFAGQSNGLIFSSTQADFIIRLQPEMRATPTITFGNLQVAIGSGTGAAVSALGNAGNTYSSLFLRSTNGSVGSTGNACVLSNANNTSGFFAADAEL